MKEESLNAYIYESSKTLDIILHFWRHWWLWPTLSRVRIYGQLTGIWFNISTW